ncbi:sigma-54 dependent transcriptional regulator [Chitinophaga agri]|uniref:Response regulator n=1 Tax=Chitinophaga agri TaxID=2703787 RepID=A0A6B9ZKR1_9BACT|nr:sigma 54-interacting transcriptional regulator [Chitinophaga agri]QHS62972.1 response regulator [Chitinophaga agri]
MTMKENILIVEDEFIVGNDLRLMLTKAGYSICGIAASVDEAKAIIEKSKPSWVLLDIFLQDGSLGTDLAGYLRQRGIGFIYISANTNQHILEIARATRPYGFLVKPFREKDLLIMLDIARYKHQNNLQMAVQREQLMRKQLQHIIDAPFELADRIARIPGALNTFVPFDYFNITIAGKRPNTLDEYSFLRSGYEEYQPLEQTDLSKSLGLERSLVLPAKIELLEELQSGFQNEDDFTHWIADKVWEKKLSAHLRLHARLAIAVTLPDGSAAVVSFFSRESEAYTEEQLALLVKMENTICQLLAQIQQKPDTAFSRVMAKKRAERISPGNEAPLFEGIIGRSPVFLHILQSINMVSAAPSSVLILGESGTGKELIARCIHKQSPRKNKPLVTVNCAALPSELIESELFGHERGAFTGATDKRAGKFELADGGTIFLDEIGELPIESQVKLLRVLQEKEFERVGGSKVIKVDVRVIAATNRNLDKEVAEGRFRLDLYYRLNVFPVELPPLRERKEDIPLLAQHFVDKLSEKLGRSVTTISPEAMKQLQVYDWPGNIREMEHLMERSLLMTSGSVLKQIILPRSTGEKPVLQTSSIEGNRIKTMEEMEIDHILHVLKACKGKVCGTGGAAEILGLPPSTLNSRIRKLGIKKDFHIRD